MLTAWRIVKPRRVDDAFPGEGARLCGGRWNSIGTPLVYTAESKALAALELLVHVDSAEILDDYLCIAVRFDKRLVKALDPQTLPDDWRSHPAPASTRGMGDTWVAERLSAILAVPSALVPGENNYLINPAHADFRKLLIGVPEPFEFDLRILKTKK